MPAEGISGNLLGISIQESPSALPGVIYVLPTGDVSSLGVSVPEGGSTRTAMSRGTVGCASS